MKILFTFLALSFSITIWSQKTPHTTEIFTVTGQIQKDMTFSLSDLERHVSTSIPDVVITNHLGAYRATAKQLSGILIKDLLKDLELKEENPKLFSEFYLVFIAKDGYKVVYSWNEIFNNPVGNHLYFITDRDGKNLKDMSDRLLVLTTNDFQTGRRHIKDIDKIVIKRVD